MTKQADVHVKILNAPSTGELMEVYDGWADRYDAELLNDWGYSSHELAIQLLERHLGVLGINVLDAGCGTGLVGALLAKAGASRVSGIDYSLGMLKKAEEKGVYAELDRMDMNTSLNLPDDRYDAVTCIGTFTFTHVQPQALRELVRITRPNGALVFTVRDDYWEAARFIDLINAMHGERLVDIEQIRLEPYIHSEGSECRFVVLRVL